MYNTIKSQTIIQQKICNCCQIHQKSILFSKKKFNVVKKKEKSQS